MKIAIKYGAISGLLIVSSWFIGYLLSGGEAAASGSELVGYIIMILAFTTVFMGIKNVRDKSEDGNLSFKTGFLTGLGIVLVASIIYVIGWMIYMPNFAPEFVDNYANSQIVSIQNSEISAEEKEIKIQEITQFIENYRRPHMMAGMTFLEIFPVGLIIAIVSALILKRKD